VATEIDIVEGWNISAYWIACLCPLALPAWCFTVTVDKHTCDKPATAYIVTPCVLFSWRQIFHAGWTASELSLDCRQVKRSFCARKVGTARDLSPGLMRPGREADHWPPSSADVNKYKVLPSTPSWRAQGQIYMYGTKIARREIWC
jgi:hypothetical protein